MFMNAMVRIFSRVERWNVPFNEAKPSWKEHFIFNEAKPSWMEYSIFNKLFIRRHNKFEKRYRRRIYVEKALKNVRIFQRSSKKRRNFDFRRRYFNGIGYIRRYFASKKRWKIDVEIDIEYQRVPTWPPHIMCPMMFFYDVVFLLII